MNNDLQIQLQELEKKLNNGMAGIADEKTKDIKEQIAEIHKTLKANQPLIDGFVSNNGKKSVATTKTLGVAIYEALQERKEDLKEIQGNKHHKFSLEIKTSGTLLTSDHLTGNPQIAYGPPAITPAQAINFRDLIPTVSSPFGTLTNYVEGTVTNSFAVQSEGALKGAQDYTWVEHKTTSQYIAAKTKFSKQLMYNLPFIQTTLVNELLRDFYKKENDYFFVTAAGNATGTNPGTVAGAATDIEELLNCIANQRSANFNPSFGLITPGEWYILLKTKPNDYSLPAGVSVSPNGAIIVGGTPIIPCSWAQSDHVLIVDANYLQRVETESLRVEFAYQNEDDFVRNLICVRCECFENINILRPESLIYHDFGNS